MVGTITRLLMPSSTTACHKSTPKRFCNSLTARPITNAIRACSMYME